MKTTSALVAMLMAGAVSVIGAQAGKKMDHAMGDMMATTYEGCVESINHGAAFVLTHVSEDHMMSHDTAMKNDDNMHAMAPAALLLTGGLNLRKHAGQEVRVTGVLSQASDHSMPRDLDTLKVSSLKIVAKSCGAEGQNQ